MQWDAAERRQRLQNSCDKLKVRIELGDLDTSLMLKCSFSHVVLKHIAGLGKFVLTNLVDKQGSVQQVATLPTRLVSKKNTGNCTNLQYFDRFRQVLEFARTKNRSATDLSYSPIGIVVAPMVELPPQNASAFAISLIDCSDKEN
ncbi:hypothetical protein PFISCL1PPCAC_21543, partial [Pristionchus fissidentatus]